MGLLTIIRKVKRKEREMRVLMVGLDNAGKTTAVRRLKDGGGDGGRGISPTLGFSICSLSRRGRKLNVWDVGGQRSLRPYWRNYFERTDGVVWVVDSSDLARLRDARAELEALLKEERLAGATLLVLANKQDVGGALGLEAISAALGLSPPPAPPAAAALGLAPPPPPPVAAGRDEGGERVADAGGGQDAGGARGGGDKEKEAAGAGAGAAAAAAAAGAAAAAAAGPAAGASSGAVGKRRHWRVAACSARTGAGLGEAFDWIVDDVASRIYMFDD